MHATEAGDGHDRLGATATGAAMHGPVALTQGAQARLRPLDQRATVLDPGGLLGGWQDLNRRATIDHCIERLRASGNLENLRRVRDQSSGPFNGFWFADSD